jgi:NADH-quinone oxidoreductase subunit C
MTPEEICKRLEERFGTDVVQARLSGGHPYALVRVDRWLEVAYFLRDQPDLGFNLLRCLAGLDLPDDGKLAAVYDLMDVRRAGGAGSRWDTRHQFAVRVEVDRDRPNIPSVAEVWPAAEWHEREAFDMLGIVFDSHPDPRRILCPEDWEGHPLRKDYEFPLEYHGIPGSTEYDLPNPTH